MSTNKRNLEKANEQKQEKYKQRREIWKMQIDENKKNIKKQKKFGKGKQTERK